MGRLANSNGTEDAACGTDGGGSGTGTGQTTSQERHSLEDRLEEWRQDPDMCLVWAAFCTNSALTLSDGYRLAKTRRRPSEILAVLSGRDADEGSEQQDAAKSAGSQADGGFSEKYAHTEVPFSPSSGSSMSWSTQATPPRPLPPQAKALWPPTTPPVSRGTAAFETSPLQEEVSFDSWAQSAYACAGPGHRLANSMHGEVRYLEQGEQGGFAVVAKVVPTDAVEKSRKREQNERRAWLTEGEAPPVEDLSNEIAVLTYLQRCTNENRFVIRFLGTFRDETFSYLVTEYCDGGELFERVAYGNPLSEAEKKRYVSQLLQAVHYLHGCNIGHRDISLENILLRRGDCVLMDFGQAVRLRSSNGVPLRYFAEAGKRLYRAPEMYVPRQHVVQVVCPSDGVPGSVAQVSYDKCRCEVLLPADASPGKPCTAEPHGYEVAPADVFACGVCAFVLVVGKPPWAVARDADPTFSFIRRHGVSMLLKQWRGSAATSANTPSQEEPLIAQMLRTEPPRRPQVDECLRFPWLASALPEERLRAQTM